MKKLFVLSVTLIFFVLSCTEMVSTAIAASRGGSNVGIEFIGEYETSSTEEENQLSSSSNEGGMKISKGLPKTGEAQSDTPIIKISGGLFLLGSFGLILKKWRK